MMSPRHFRTRPRYIFTCINYGTKKQPFSWTAMVKTRKAFMGIPVADSSGNECGADTIYTKLWHAGRVEQAFGCVVADKLKQPTVEAAHNLNDTT